MAVLESDEESVADAEAVYESRSATSGASLCTHVQRARFGNETLLDAERLSAKAEIGVFTVGDEVAIEELSAGLDDGCMRRTGHEQTGTSQAAHVYRRSRRVSQWPSLQCIEMPSGASPNDAGTVNAALRDEGRYVGELDERPEKTRRVIAGVRHELSECLRLQAHVRVEHEHGIHASLEAVRQVVVVRTGEPAVVGGMRQSELVRHTRADLEDVAQDSRVDLGLIDVDV